MKKFYFFLLVCVMAHQTMLAQTTPALTSGYYFKSKTNVILEDMTGATNLVGAIRSLDQVSAVTPITFPFEFVTKSLTSFQAFSSGTVVLLNPQGPTSSTVQVIFPWSDDLFTGDNGYINYKVIEGMQRKLVVEFFLSKYVASGPAIADKKFQVWFFENSNQIQFVYGDGNAVGAQAVVGLAGAVDLNSAAQGDLLQLDTYTHSITNITTEYYSSDWPGTGRSYVFSPTPLPAVDPVANVSASGASTTVCQGAAIHLTSNLQDATATSYQWLKDGASIAGATSADFQASETGKYAVRISYDGGALTSNSIDVFVTALSASVAVTNVTCNANGNGSITVKNATGGNSLMEYTIGNGTWQQSEVFSNLLPGSYAVSIRSGNCSTTLGNYTINDTRTSPEVTITKSNGGACANVTLTANPTGALAYTWSNGSTNSSITLGNDDADGQYSVTVSNGTGCEASATYQYNKQDQLNSYVLLVSKTVSLGDNNIVNGSIGNSVNLPVYLSNNSQVNGFIRSSAIKLSEGVLVSEGSFMQPSAITTPTMYINTSVITSLTSHKTTDDFTGSLSLNYKKLEVGKRAKVVLTGTVFGQLIVNEGAEVTFTASDISIDNIVASDGNSSPLTFTTLHFAPNTIVRIKNKMSIGKRNKVNAAGATFYLGDVKGDDDKVVVDAGTDFRGNILLPHGKLTARTSALLNTTMTGAFICQYVVADKNVTWSRNICNIFAPRAVASVRADALSKIKFAIYPNPSRGRFNLITKSGSALKTEVTIMNASGVVINSQTLFNVGSGRTIPLYLDNQPAGIYLVKLTTGKTSQSIKVVLKK